MSGLAVSGDYGTSTTEFAGVAISGNRGSSVSERSGVAIAGGKGAAETQTNGLSVAGVSGKVRAGIGGVLVLARRQDLTLRCAQVDGTTIKADTWYRLDYDGNFVEVADE